MRFDISRKPHGLGAVITGLDLGEATPELARQVRDLLYENKFLVIKGQTMGPAQYIRFAKYMGDIVKFVDPNYWHPEHPEIFVVSNVTVDGQKIGMDRVGYYWHSDSSFMPTPLPLTMLYSQRASARGGETCFISMDAVLASLPGEVVSSLEGKQALHESKWRYIIMESDVGLSIQEVIDRDERLVPPSVHPTMIVHPFTKRRQLYVNEGFTRAILNLPKESSDTLLEAVFQATRGCEATYTHAWEPNEIVIWDNRQVVHRAMPPAPGEDRMMFRIGVRDGTFYEV
jgi:taurine dioxygenase